MSDRARGLTAEEILADTDGQRALVRFCQEVEAGETPSPEMLNYLAARFRRILDGEKAAKALDLNKPRGHPSRTLKQADEEFANHAEKLFEIIRRRKAGQTHDQAIGAVAQQFGIPEDTLRDYWKRQRKVALAAWSMTRSAEHLLAVMDLAEARQKKRGRK